jgi:hypothetical protein
VKQLETIPYRDGGRELCVTGSCLLTAADTALGRAIRFFQGGGAFCSHAAPVVRFPEEFVGRDRVTLIEALEHGLTPTYLSRYFKDFDGRLFLFTPAGLTELFQARFAAWLVDRMCAETPYGYRDLVRQTRGRVEQDDKALFCSEAYGMALEAAGLPRLAEAPAGLAPQPSDIPNWWLGRVVELVGPFGAQEAAA